MVYLLIGWTARLPFTTRWIRIINLLSLFVRDNENDTVSLTSRSSVEIVMSKIMFFRREFFYDEDVGIKRYKYIELALRRKQFFSL